MTNRLALAGETGERWSDAFLHRCRGEILLKRDPVNTAPAEAAFLTAIAIAKQQRARSSGLRAALDLARLCNSTSHSADAHALLASALKGFSPTPEFSEIAEAQMLLTAWRHEPIEGAAEFRVWHVAAASEWSLNGTSPPSASVERLDRATGSCWAVPDPERSLA